MGRILWLVLLAGCTTTTTTHKPDPTSRGLRADEHLDAAREHARRASELERWPRRDSDIGRFDDPSTGLWYRMWDQPQEHERLATTHANAAAQIHAAFDEACANIAPDHIRVSPLQRFGVGSIPLPDGIVMLLGTEAGTADQLLAELRCHRAWMMMDGSEMEQCPLDLPNIQLRAYGDKTGISVEITTPDPKLVPELQRRAARELELAGRNTTTTRR